MNITLPVEQITPIFRHQCFQMIKQEGRYHHIHLFGTFTSSLYSSRSAKYINNIIYM